MWVDDYDKEFKSCKTEILELRKKWLEKDPKNLELEKKAKDQIICYGYKPINEKMICLNPCEICDANQEMSACFTEGERFSGASFGDIFNWCGNCGQCNHTKWDEY